MKLTKLSLGIVGCASLAAGFANAAGPTLSEVIANSGITATGFAAAGYNYQSAQGFVLDPFAGASESTFNLNQAAVTISKLPTEGWGGLVNLTVGRDADYIRSYPYKTPTVSAPTPGTQVSINNPGNGFDVTQAFVQYAKGPVTVQLGKFVTLASAEVIAPVGNTNITRSIEFFSVPYTHTGVRATYAASSTLSLIAGVNNGWDQQTDANSGKTAELGLAWSPTSMVTWAVQAYYGAENANASNQPIVLTPNRTYTSNRTLVDSVLTIKPTSALTLILNTDYGKQESTPNQKSYAWTSLVGYANYQFTEKLRTSLRVETFNDEEGLKLGLLNQNGVTPVTNVGEATFTVGYAPEPSYEVRAEVRADKSNGAAFTKFNNKVADENYTFAVEGLYKF